KRIGTMNELAERIEALLPTAAEADEQVAKRGSEAVITGEQVVIGDPLSPSLAMQKTANSLTTSVVLPRRARWWLPAGAASLALLGAAALWMLRGDSASPAIAHLPSATPASLSSAPVASVPIASPPRPADSSAPPIVSPGPAVSAGVTPAVSASAAPSASAAQAPSAKAPLLPATKAPPKPKGSASVWGYD
ncbi:MAG: hypothetical protein ABI193_00190, partial [Minicystis sp.]